MRNHYFSIDGKIWKQRDGSPIGLDISVEIAGLYMSMWDKLFLDKVRKAGLKLRLYKKSIHYPFSICLVRQTEEKHSFTRRPEEAEKL